MSDAAGVHAAHPGLLFLSHLDGQLEGINNKIRVLNHRAYGHRDLDFLALRIQCIHETKFALSGT